MKTYDYIQGVPRRGNEDPHGCIRVWFAPEYEEIYINDRLIRSIIPGTYVAVYDPVGIDKDKKEITDWHSHNSIFVIEMPRERNGFKPKPRPVGVGDGQQVKYSCTVYERLSDGMTQ